MIKERPDIIDQIDEQISSDLSNDHGWPQSLCLISAGDGRYACNCADTKGLEPEPQTELNGLAVFVNEASANLYMEALNGLSGEIVPKTFDECRQIAVDKPVLKAMFLMHGAKILDIVYVR